MYPDTVISERDALKMSLDEFIESQKTYEIGRVSSKKDPKDIGLSKKVWLYLIHDSPETAEFIITMSDLDNEEIKSIIQLFDSIIDDDVRDFRVSDEKAEKVEEYRQILVEEQLQS